MATLSLLLHFGAYGYGGYHPGFFLFGPGLFWFGLLAFFILMKMARGARPAPDARWGHEHHERRAAAPPAPPSAPPAETSGGGPAWPELYPEPPAQPRPKKDQDIEIL
jgi:hypothetical protein